MSDFSFDIVGFDQDLIRRFDVIVSGDAVIRGFGDVIGALERL